MANCSSTSITAVLAMAIHLIILPAKADMLSIGLDLSGSVPLVTDSVFANHVAEYLRDSINKLKIGDHVQLRTFGLYGMSNNIRRLDVTISRRDRPSQVATAVYTIVRSVPKLVGSGKLQAQGETNILGYLDGEARLLSCASEPTEIILVTDGVENSDLIRGQDLISGKGKLPTSTGHPLAGCSMTIIGIGQLAKGASAKTTQKLVSAWAEWADSAGTREFKALPSF